MAPPPPSSDTETTSMTTTATIAAPKSPSQPSSPRLKVNHANKVVTDGSIVVATSDETNMETPPSAGTSLLMYTLIGFFIVFGIFLLCISADAMGRGIVRIGKSVILADGSGHSSMITEIIIFVLVFVFIGVYLHQAFSTTPAPADTTQTKIPLSILAANQSILQPKT